VSRRYSSRAARVLTTRSAPTVSGSSTASTMGSSLAASTVTGLIPVACSTPRANASVTDGATAFQVVWETDYDVIVTEIGMPGIDGRDLYMAFQNTWPELTRRMLFVCGHPTAAIEDFAARTGVPFVRTPMSVTELREAVQAVVAGPPSRAIA